MGLYEDAMKRAVEFKQRSKQRTRENTEALLGWMTTMDELVGAPSGGGGGGKVGSGPLGSNAASIRNTMEGRGPSSGPIPGMKTWKWRDPIDDQLFRVTTAKGTKKQFKPFLSALARTGYDVDSIGGYVHRNARGSNRLSEHAYGKAIDINPGANPMGANLVTDMPKNVAEIAALYDLVWGGTWKSKKDAMHFSTTGW